ncbi:MAG TPA: SurA N-terminal domain-containing protein [Magnetospirillaceae bacterium]|nr:SurA N-terminal domain-containing protein [Magnetospirillaceae bacterium]
MFKKTGPAPETGGRITNETVAEHRERVLAGGRKFKYPLQYTTHRILFISIIISILALIIFIAFFVWQLYFAQAYDRFTYGLTRVLPVPVAKVDTELVRYSDYLSELRSAVHYLTTKEAVNFNSVDGKRQLDFYKRLALDKAVRNALVAKLASDNKITITAKEVDDFVKHQLESKKLGVTEEDYKRVISDYYDRSFDEYKNAVRQELLHKKVSATLDIESRGKAEWVVQQIASGGNFGDLARLVSDDPLSKASGGDIGFVSKDSEDPSGLIAAAQALQLPGHIAGPIEGVDGFYIIQLIEKRDTGDVRFAKIFISYKLIPQKLAELKAQNKINEFIKVDQIANPMTQ